MSGSEELFSAPPDLTLVSDSDLATLQEKAKAEFNRVHGSDNVTPELLEYAVRLTSDLDKINAEIAGREVKAERLAQQERDRTSAQLAQLNERVNGAPKPEEKVHIPPVDAEAITAAAAQGATQAFINLVGERRGGDMVKRAAASLTAASAQQPDPKVQSARQAVTASVDIPGVSSGGALPTLEALGDAFTRKAKAIPTTSAGRGAGAHSVATVRNTFQHTVNDRTSNGEMENLLESVLTRDAKSALVAGGGWCAPSEQRYDFFNIAGVDGLIDLPTVGVSRGGIKYPTSPAIGDVFFQNVGSSPASGFGGFAFTMSNATDPWLWTESDDILTVTGSVNKPTLRVPCPTQNEVRLECYGLSITAGNLADDAYPEATQNFLKLAMVAYQHAINGRLISLMDTAAGGATTISGGAATDAAAPRIFNAAGLAAADYRARYAMRTDDVLEVVLPYWVKEVIRGDLAWKAGVELMAVTDAEVNAFFTSRNLRPQWVNDYQVRGSGQFGAASALTAWPTTVNFLVYAAGTFLHGNGLSLDLGVIRDSVLNAENDHTAAWMEECHLIALVGHAARKYTVGFNVNGSTSALLTGTVRV